MRPKQQRKARHDDLTGREIKRVYVDKGYIGHDAPSATVNEWISHLLVLYRPTIGALLHARDDILKSHQPSDADTHVHDDRSLEVISIVDIDVRSQLDAVEAALA